VKPWEKVEKSGAIGKKSERARGFSIESDIK
jgi:hypothetical protein